LLNIKIYEPYFISSSTILQYKVEQKINVDVKVEKYSIKEILESQFSQERSKLYFKVDLFDEYGNPSHLIKNVPIKNKKKCSPSSEKEREK
jgi:hypothetical protein